MTLRTRYCYPDFKSVETEAQSGSLTGGIITSVPLLLTALLNPRFPWSLALFIEP
jgi:hypothetical protein